MYEYTYDDYYFKDAFLDAIKILVDQNIKNVFGIADNLRVKSLVNSISSKKGTEKRYNHVNKKATRKLRKMKNLKKYKVNFEAFKNEFNKKYRKIQHNSGSYGTVQTTKESQCNLAYSLIINSVSNAVDLKDAIERVLRAYSKCIDETKGAKKIKNINNQVTTYIPEQKKTTDTFDSLLALTSSILKKGPKKGLCNNNRGVCDIRFLDALANDILLLMLTEQPPCTRNSNPYTRFEEYGAVYGGYAGYGLKIDNLKEKKEKILKTYGVSNIDELLKLYDKIHNKFYKAWNKLNDKQRNKLKNNKHSTISTCLLVEKNYKGAYYEFPPNREELINKYNNIVINNKDAYAVVSQQIVGGMPKNYYEVKSYYSNLSRYMSIEETIRFWKKIQIYLSNESTRYTDSKLTLPYRDAMSPTLNIFCEIIAQKKGIKNPTNEDITEIAKTYFERGNMNFEKEMQDRIKRNEEMERSEKTLEEQYLRYRQGRPRSQVLSFDEWKEKRFTLNQNSNSDEDQYGNGTSKTL